MGKIDEEGKDTDSASRKNPEKACGQAGLSKKEGMREWPLV